MFDVPEEGLERSEESASASTLGLLVVLARFRRSAGAGRGGFTEDADRVVASCIMQVHNV